MKLKYLVKIFILAIVFINSYCYSVIDQTKPVLVTGATGYIAGVLIKKLLNEGICVHATVRDPNDAEKIKYLKQIVENTNGSIKFFKADPLTKGSFDEAMKGCELVYHTASPFNLHVKDPKNDLLIPAVDGTENVLNSVNNTSSVKRVVLTSSVAAIYDNNRETHAKEAGLTESDWNKKSSLINNPYFYSKTRAEQKAWDIAKAQKRWELVIINPSFVIGPRINPNSTSESYRIIKQLGNGDVKWAVPKIGFSIVDVRDVAIAHYEAGFNQNAKGRYIIAAHSTTMFDMAQTLLKKYGKDYPIPRWVLPKYIAWLFAPWIDKSLT